MRIAVIGPGAIGSSFAFLLSRAGHEVSVVARGARLAQLTADGALVTTTGEKAPVKVLPALGNEAFDLVLVTVLASQVEAVVPALQANPSKLIMFMFNAFDGLPALRDAVGRERFAWGFPAMIATLAEGKLALQVVPRLASMIQITTVGGLADFAPPGIADWAKVFSKAGIPCAVHPDMESWLRSHAAFMVPLMVVGVRVVERGRGLTGAGAREIAEGMQAAFGVVRALGNRVTPLNVALLGRLPRWLISGVMWLISRTSMAKALGANGDGEARWLITSMAKAGSADQSAALVSLVPQRREPLTPAH